MATIIRSADVLTAEALTKILRRAGALREGSVSHVTIEPLDGTTANLARLRLEYTTGADGTLPASLVLKLCDNPLFGRSEVDYYTRDYVGLPDAPLPICYDACYAPEAQRYHLLLEDLSATHRNTWRLEPSLAGGVTAAEALAVLHAYHWRTSSAGKRDFVVPGKAQIDEYIAHIIPGLEPLIASLDDSELAWATPLREIFAAHPGAMLRRSANPEGFTLVHGDPNPGNILSPIDGAGRTYLIDRQPFPWSLTVWLGVADVAYMMVHWWEPEQRRQYERAVLRAYHNRLLSRGIPGYGWEQLLLDYRLCAVHSIYVATAWCAREDTRRRMQWVWRPQLRRAMTAYADLDCRALLQR